jgi:hypothetical protein
MRMKRFSLLLLALVFITSLAVVGCGGGGGNATPTATATQTQTATQTPTATQNPTTTPSSSGYWEVDYKIVDGSYIVLNYSAAGMTPLKKTLYFNESNGGTFKLLVSKTEVDGTREVIMPAADFIWPKFTVKAIMTGINMDLLLEVDHDATGTLYTEDGIGDVDMSSSSNASKTPIQVDTYGDGTKDPAGSMVIPIPLVGNFETSVGQDGSLVFGLVYTTGHTDNTVHITMNKKMDGAFIEGDGALFEEDGDMSPAPYVGTAGTLTTTGTGDCLGIRLVGVRIDFQYLQVMVMEPVSVH